MIRIDRIEVEGFRGISRPSYLPLDGKSLLLFGENGTGKSSFVDALEMLFTGALSALEGRMGVSVDHHGPNIRTDAPPIIQVRFSDGTSFALETDVDQLPKDVDQYLAAANTPLFILRRRQLLDFIESRPRELYEMLRPFLPLAQAEEAEAGLHEAAQSADRVATKVERILGNTSENIAVALSISEYKAPLSEELVCEALSVQLRTVEVADVKTISEAERVMPSLDRRMEKFGDTQRLVALHNAKTHIGELGDSLVALSLESMRSDLAALRSQEEAVGRAFYEDVLQRGLEWIQVDWQGVCPLCETHWDEKPHDKDALVSRIQARLDDMTEVVGLREKAEDTRVMLLEATGAARDRSQMLLSELQEWIDAGDLKSLDALFRATGEVENVLGQRLDQITVDELEDAIELRKTTLRASSLEELQDRVESAASSLPSPSELKPLVEIRSLLDRVLELWQKQSDVADQYEAAHQRAQLTSLMLNLAIDARKDELQRILDEISQDINDLYEKATGSDQGLRNIRLQLRPEVSSSVVWGSAFYDREDEVPFAYGSDAQLDILGLCTFLALRRWYQAQNPDFGLVILDDVLTSVDSQHAVRTAELILREFEGYQILITTHDRIWYDHLRDIQARCRVKGQFLNKVIHKWTLEQGPDLREPEEERQRLEELLDDGGARETAMEAGLLLEHVLQEMRYSLQLSVRAKRGELYEIGEIWPAFYSAVEKRYPGFYEHSRNTLDALDVRWTIRNWVGAHFNTWAARVSREEVVEFGRAVADLFDLVFCMECRRFIVPSVAPAGQLSCRKGELIYPAPGKDAVEPLRGEELVASTKGAFRDSELTTDLYFEWKRAEIAQEKD